MKKNFQSTNSQHLLSPKETIEHTLWKAADKLRKNIDAGEYKHIVLGLIFLKYISGTMSNETTWKNLKKCSQTTDTTNLGKKIIAAVKKIEKQQPILKDIFPVKYFQLHQANCEFGNIIDLIDGLPIHTHSDLLGKIYEYFLGKFALAEGRKSGQFYTPPCIVKLLVEMLEPFQGKVYDPCCGSGSMFVQSEKFMLAHQGSPDDITVYGQESNATTHRLCRMNLAIRSIDASHIQWNNKGSFLQDAHPDLKADYILANPPFNDSDWSGEQLTTDPRWQYGVPPRYNANFAWLQHIVSHLSPRGCAGIVLANGSLSTQRPAESTIRKNLVEKGIIDCIVGLPDRLFYNTGISACLWFLKRREKHKAREHEEHDILFIDARSLGHMINRRNRELSEQDIHTIAGLYHDWLSNGNDGSYKNIKGLCQSVSLEAVRRQQYFLTPTRYVGISKMAIDDTASFEKRMEQISEEFKIIIDQGAELDRLILETMKNPLRFED